MLAQASLYRGVIASVRGDTQQAIEKITFAQERLPQEKHLSAGTRIFSAWDWRIELSGQTALADTELFEIKRRSAIRRGAFSCHQCAWRRCTGANQPGTVTPGGASLPGSNTTRRRQTITPTGFGRVHSRQHRSRTKRSRCRRGIPAKGHCVIPSRRLDR